MDTSNRSTEAVKELVLGYITSGEVREGIELSQKDRERILRSVLTLAHGHLKYLGGYEPIGERIRGIVGDKDPEGSEDDIYSDEITSDTKVTPPVTLTRLFHLVEGQKDVTEMILKAIFVSQDGHFIYWTGRYQQQNKFGSRWHEGAGVFNRTCHCRISKMNEGEIINICSRAKGFSFEFVRGLLDLVVSCIKKKKEVLEGLCRVEKEIRGISHRMSLAK